MTDSEPMLEGMAQTALDRPEPILRAGNTNCGGCGMSILLQMLSRAAGSHPIQFSIPACCAIVTAGQFPYSAYGAPVVSSTFAATAAVATGLAHAARLNGEKTRVIGFAGDGGSLDIGMATLSAAAERNEDILYICYDNEIYANTGGQRSSATPFGASTTTTVKGKDVAKKDAVAIMAAHRIPYAATISMAHPDDTHRKLKYAVEASGFRFLHVLAPCPTGWKSEPDQSVELVRLAVKSGLFAVYEVFDGLKYRINIEPEYSEAALKRYLQAQGRFRKLEVDFPRLREDIARGWRYLRHMASMEV